MDPYYTNFLFEAGKTYTIPDNIKHKFLVCLNPYYYISTSIYKIFYKVEINEKDLDIENGIYKEPKNLLFYIKTIKIIEIIDNPKDNTELIEWYKNKDVLEFIKNLPLNPTWRSNTMFAISTKNNKCILVNYNGELINQFKFFYITDVYDDIAVAWSMNKCKIISNKGELITSESFSEIQIKQEEDGKRVIMGKPIASDTYKSPSIWNFIDDDGDIIFNKCPYKIVGTHITDDGYVMVETFVRGQVAKNFINKDNDLLWKEWEENIIVDDDFSDDFVRIKSDVCSYNYRHKNGKFLLKYQAEDIAKFKNGIGMIRENDKYKLINTQGEIVGVASFDTFLKYNYK